ncbi:NAD(P)-dependent oxidoreductase [Leptospira gomenensis]|uniref:NAD(P)-dependent oxidoreductase n=1 Tax=Leptospira gomenensis TaxID=2484974 RepID=A0A5F1Y6S6_9LEPT|nr:NAD(P)-dependent oxidoreductase [Leptospira gomenensis]TGK27960.1 NAD(P)-dependent oxidoreductase [Leptospira gomenensis]TGK37185.1 NAD(P)-dependent oxidoreductase [Leptospira gomenensis]TGK45821.1 NAD(P)-dependent oxidoreductase [Leptospira gomenensis]TGK59760.1 NAD(P)-dependent oxidoreductase [Leptospira gomenensis]
MKERSVAAKTILVTGGSGSLGAVLLPELLKEYRTVCIGRKLSSFSDAVRFHPNFVFYEADLERDEKILIPETPEFILHMAGKVSGEGVSLEDYRRANETSTRNVLKIASKNRKTGILFTSSTSVYGFSERPMRETSPLNGNTPYAISKIECESMIRSSKHPFVILRVSSVYGPTNKSFLNKLLRIFKFGVLLCSGNPDFRKSLVHSSDVVASVLIVLKKWKKATGNTYNVAYPEPLSTSEIEILFTESDPKKPYVKIGFSGITLVIFNILNFFSGKFLKKRLSVEYIQESSVIDSQKIQKELGFQFKTNFEEGIRTIDTKNGRNL